MITYILSRNGTLQKVMDVTVLSLLLLLRLDLETIKGA